MNTQVQFTIGADPEIFLKAKGKAVSAHGVIPGSKQDPFPVENGAIQVDGMAVEFNINPSPLNSTFGGVADFNVFNNNVTSVMEQLKDKVKESNPDLTFNIESVQDFDPEYMAAQPDDAKELGCDPDFCAWTGEVNPRPDGMVNFRTASGHIHIGWGQDIPVEHPDHMAICCNFVKYLDATVGMFMTIIDADPRRRTLYGKAGAFRPKSYGVEYRTPANLWLVNKERRRMVFELSRLAVSIAQQEANPAAYAATSWDNIRRIVDEGDYVEAKKVLDNTLRHYWLPQDIRSIYEKEFKVRWTKDNPGQDDPVAQGKKAKKKMVEKALKTTVKNYGDLRYDWAMADVPLQVEPA